MSLEGRETGLEQSQAVDPDPQVRALRGEHGRKLRRRFSAMAGLAPAGESRRIVEGEVKATEIQQEPDPLPVLGTVVAIPVLARSGRGRNPLRS